MTALLIPRLDPSVPLFSPIGSNFSGLVAATLGNAGTSQDGWDADFDKLISTVPGLSGAMDGDPVVAGLTDLTPAELVAIDPQPVIDATAPFLAKGDQLYAALATGAPPTQPTTPATGPTGGGGGGTTGGGGGGGGPAGGGGGGNGCIEGDEPGCFL